MRKFDIVYLLIFILLLPVVSLQAQDNERKIPAAYIANENKPIMLFFTADWCLPCKAMKEDMFKREEIKPLISEFNILMMDIETEEGKSYMKAYGPEKMAIPHIILMDKDQNVIVEKTGYNSNSDNFIAFLNKVLIKEE